MERLPLSAVYVSSFVCHQTWYNSQNTLHPFCNWRSRKVNMAFTHPEISQRTLCILRKSFQLSHLTIRRKNIYTYPHSGVRERLVFPGKCSHDGLPVRRRFNLANSRGRTELRTRMLFTGFTKHI